VSLFLERADGGVEVAPPCRAPEFPGWDRVSAATMIPRDALPVDALLGYRHDTTGVLCAFMDGASSRRVRGWYCRIPESRGWHAVVWYPGGRCAHLNLLCERPRALALCSGV